MSKPSPSASPSASPHVDELIRALEVSFVRLTECVVSPGFGLQLSDVPAPGLHYNIRGTGKGYLKNGAVVDLQPHTLIIVPPNMAFRIEVPAQGRPQAPVRVHDGTSEMRQKPLHRFVVGEGAPEVILICGYFRASYGVSTDLFQSVRAPIVEQFRREDLVEDKLRDALNELLQQEVGAGAMSAALLKQVLVTVIRRSLQLVPSWNDQFALLRDEQVARAFARMAAMPGAAHSVQSLAKTAGLSRSAFMERFVHVVGRPPMEVLRDLRMRQAADYAQRNELTVEQIASRVGYSSRSSFVRAFKRAHGVDPSRFRSQQEGA
jgi:AraC-like DNA-binding protein